MQEEGPTQRTRGVRPRKRRDPEGMVSGGRLKSGEPARTREGTAEGAQADERGPSSKSHQTCRCCAAGLAARWARLKILSGQVGQVTPWAVAHQAPLSVGFSRQDTSGLPFPSPGDLPHPGIKLRSPTLQEHFFFLPSELPGKPHVKKNSSQIAQLQK